MNNQSKQFKSIGDDSWVGIDDPLGQERVGPDVQEAAGHRWPKPCVGSRYCRWRDAVRGGRLG